MIRLLIRTFQLPGVILHEIVHAVVVVLLPGLTITTFNPVQGQVQYEETVPHSLTIPRSALIGIAPLLFNTLFAMLLFVSAMTAPTQTGQASLTILGASIASTALPSSTDLLNPISVGWQRLSPTIHGVMISPILIGYAVIGGPAGAVAWISEQIGILKIGIDLGVAILIWTVTQELLVV